MLKIRITCAIVLAAAAWLAFNWPGAELIAQERTQPITVTVRGRVLDDESRPIRGESVRVRVYVRGVAPFETKSEPDGRYMVQVPLAPSQSIDKICFDHPLKHPEEMTLFSGADASEEINKLMSDIDGPETYERNIDQLLAYEGFYYRKIAVGAAAAGELERVRNALTKMPRPGAGSKQLEDMNQDSRKIQLLARKRAEVFRLYGLEPDAGAKIAGLGVCGKCALHVTAECKNTVILASGGPRLYFINDGTYFKANHELLCHTTVPVAVEGAITKEVRASKSGAVAFGEIQATTIAADSSGSLAEGKAVIFAGVGQCSNCDLKQTDECRNVLRCKIEGKPRDIWLPEDSHLHMTNQTFVVAGTLLKSPAPGFGGLIAPTSVVAIPPGGAAAN
jgi:hypothetical protein